MIARFLAHTTTRPAFLAGFLMAVIYTAILYFHA